MTRDRPIWLQDRIILAGLALLLLASSWAAPNDYVVSLVVTFLINLILVASLNMLMGQGGLVSLGHGGFLGLGAYTSGILSAKLALSAWVGVPTAVLVTAFTAAIVGLPTLRLRGHYLSMATLGFNAILVVLFNQVVTLTGGPNGLLGVHPFAIGSLTLDTQLSVLPLVWFCAVLVLLLLWNLLDSRFGRALRAIAASEAGAASLGIDLFATKLKVFVLTAAMAGLAGGLYVHSNLYASPETFGVSTSILLVAMVAIGGRGHRWGPVLGAAVMTVLPEVLRSFADAELLVFGTALIAVLMVFPRGLAGLMEKWPGSKKASA